MPARRIARGVVLATVLLVVGGFAGSVAAAPDDGGAIDTDHIVRVLTLRDHNTKVVVLGTALLGVAAGITGTYMLLRKRALIGDALSHATLPGIGVAFMTMVHLGGTGKFLPGLLLGAIVTGLLGVGAILLIKGMTRIKEDAALGIVLSVSFGVGVVLLGVIQKMPTGNQAGLESFIYGKTASMLARDAMLIGATALVVIVVCAIFAKEFTLLSFDPAYAGTQGWPVPVLDLVMMLLVTGVTVVGLQAVGLILVVALLIIPAAAARFWTDHLRTTLVVAGAIGAVSGFAGAALSALVPRLPAGAIIVLVAASMFGVSLLVGRRGGVVVRLLDHRRLERSVARQHLLRALYEWLESRGRLEEPAGRGAPRRELLAARSWSGRQLDRTIHGLRRDGLAEPGGGDGPPVRLTTRGLETAARIARNHRLWELYLITHADIAPSHVDRDADQIEHVLGPTMVGQLEALLVRDRPALPPVPPSPHVLPASASEGGAG